MNTRMALRKILAFFSRDIAIAKTYRGAFVLELFEALFGVATFYYLSRFVESPQLRSALPQGGSYFAFALVGFAFFDYLSVSINAFDSSIESARQNRTLEALLVTQTPLWLILAGSTIYPFALFAIRMVVYIAWGVFLFGFPLQSVNWLGATLVLAASILSLAGFGVFSAAYLILFKRGNPAKWFIIGLSGLVGGLMYPVSILPRPLQILARLIPVSYSLEGMRAALLGGSGLRELAPAIGALLLFASVLIPTSFGFFSWAVRRTKITGTLTHL
jgi:ABC-2 type transport system permease protein